MGVRQQRKEQTRQRILAAAQQLVEEQGYEGTTLRAVGQRAGVTAGTIFVHFNGKDALLMAALAEGIQRLLSSAHASFPVDAPLLDQLHHHPRCLLQAYAQHPALRDLLRRTFTLQVEDTGPLFDQAVVAVSTWAQHIGGAQARGELRADSDATLMAKACWAYYWQAVTLLLQAEPPRVEEPIALNRALLEQLLRGAAARDRSAYS
jgi:AcrR family transcriptional regulator